MTAIVRVNFEKAHAMAVAKVDEEWNKVAQGMHLLQTVHHAHKTNTTVSGYEGDEHDAMRFLRTLMDNYQAAVTEERRLRGYLKLFEEEQP